jgi:hypothetical protein
VIIAHDDVRPVEIASPHLFVSKPQVAIGSSDVRADAAAAGNGDIAQVATNAHAVTGADIAEGGSASLLSGARAAPAKVVPISVLVSRKAGRLFVRQGFAPVLDVPVTIRNPEEPLGTHVFTAMELQNDGTTLRWTVVSMPEGTARSAEHAPDGRHDPRKEPARPIVAPAAAVPPAAGADTALARVEIPKDAVDRISELLTPGASLIVSDHDVSRETGKDTDFIVLTH